MSRNGPIEMGKAIPVRPLPRNIRSLMRVKVEHHKYRDGNGEPSACWIWQGDTDKDGYPKIRVRQKNVFAHRLSFAVFHDDYELDGFDVHHECLEKLCINPQHLEKIACAPHRITKHGKNGGGNGGDPIPF